MTQTVSPQLSSINGSNHQSITLGTGVYSPAMPASSARFLVVQAITQNVRFTLSNGVVPTASVGFQLLASDPPLAIPLGTNVTPQFIREASGAILQVQFMD